MAASESDLMAFYQRFQTLSLFNDSSARLIEVGSIQKSD